jgi:DNA ligase (NAD+)
MPDHWKAHPIINVELLIKMADWNPKWGANPRNTVAGWLNRNTPISQRIITAVDHERSALHLNIYPPYNLSELVDTFLHLYADWSTIYPMDGLMVKLQSYEERTQVGHDTRRLLWSLAWKPPIEAKWTEVVDIHWNVSRSGRVIPKVEYVPIELCGTKNRFATGNNARWVEAHAIHKGAQIKIGKAGEIIPKILRVKADGGATLPERCPICGTILEWNGVDLLCDSTECIARQVKRLAYFYSDKGMEIKSIGEAMIEQLLQNERCYTILKDAPWALLEPDTYAIYDELVATWGEARTETYLDNLADLSNSKNPAHFIAALGYKNLAYKTALACFQTFLEYATPSRSIANSVSAFSLGLRDFRRAMETLKYFQLCDIPRPAEKLYCITGTLSVGRTEMVSYLAGYNWQIMNQVSKNVNLLIVGELNKESTKLRKAKELGVTIITEEQLPDWLPPRKESIQNGNKSHKETNSRS